MKSKLVGIMIGVMMLATILPITAMATTDSPTNSNGSGPFDHTTIRGIVLFKRTSDGGKDIHFFAIRVHYTTVWLSGEHEQGVIKLTPIVVPSDMAGFYGHFYIIASFRGSLK
jgi:hypothetical protein